MCNLIEYKDMLESVKNSSNVVMGWIIDHNIIEIILPKKLLRKKNLFFSI